LLAGCSGNEPKFHYGENVFVTAGFYQSCEGYVYGILQSGMEYENKYLITFTNCNSINVLIKESELWGLHKGAQK